MKKNILLYILILLAIFAVFIFQNKKPADDNKKTVVFWTLQLGTFDKYINNIITEFENQNPDIKIKWVDIPYSEGEKRTLAAILTDNPPDLINLTPDFSLMLAQKNALYTIDKEYLENYLPSLLEILKYNDNYFGIPFYATSAITLYNKNLISQNPHKQLPKTYEDLFNLKLSADSKYYITMLNLSENDTLLKLLNKYNINTPESLESEKSIKLFNELKRIYQQKLIPLESLTQTHRDSLEKYMSGQIAFLITGANFLNMIKENAPDVYKSTGMLPQLTGDTGCYDYSLMNFAVPKKAANPKEAVKFAIFLTNKDNQLEFAQLTPILPVNKYALANEYFKDNSKQFKTDSEYLTYLLSSDKTPEVKARMISAIQLNKIQPPLKNIKNKKDLNTLSANYIQDILINNAPVKETLKKFAKDWQEL